MIALTTNAIEEREKVGEMKDIAGLPSDAVKLLDAILLAFKAKLPFDASMNDAEFLTAAHQLLETDLIRITERSDGSMALAVAGTHYPVPTGMRPNPVLVRKMDKS